MARASSGRVSGVRHVAHNNIIWVCNVFFASDTRTPYSSSHLAHFSFVVVLPHISTQQIMLIRVRSVSTSFHNWARQIASSKLVKTGVFETERGDPLQPCHSDRLAVILASPIRLFVLLPSRCLRRPRAIVDIALLNSCSTHGTMSMRDRFGYPDARSSSPLEHALSREDTTQVPVPSR